MLFRFSLYLVGKVLDLVSLGSNPTFTSHHEISFPAEAVEPRPFKFLVFYTQASDSSKLHLKATFLFYFFLPDLYRQQKPYFNLVKI